MERNWNRKTTLLLVVAHWNQDISWVTTQKYFPFVIGRKYSDEPICGVPINKGAEGSTYLKFIIGNWDELPQRVCFLDDHERSWHQDFDMIDKLRKIERSSRWSGGFLPLNNLKIDTMDEFRYWQFELFSPVWDAVVKPHLSMDCPKRIIADGSAQFIVSRDRIRANPKTLYEDLYGYAIGKKRWKGDENWRDAHGFSYAPGGQDWVGGNYFLEWIWHLIFGCPAENTSDLPDGGIHGK